MRGANSHSKQHSLKLIVIDGFQEKQLKNNTWRAASTAVGSRRYSYFI